MEIVRFSMNGAMRLRRIPPTDLLEEGRGLRPYRYSTMTILCETTFPKKAAEDGTLNADRMATCVKKMVKKVAEDGMRNADHMATFSSALCFLLCVLVLAKNPLKTTPT